MAKFSILQVAQHTGTEDSRSIPLTVKDLPIEEIRIQENIRKDYEDIPELQASIRRYGLLQPITVYRDGEGYAVKTGHRRYLAYRELYQQEPDRFSRIRCIISDDADIVVIQLVENVQRSDLSPKDLYDALLSLRSTGYSHKQIADFMGKSVQYVDNLFTGVNELEKNQTLLTHLTTAGGSIQDIAETKGIPDEQERIRLLEQRTAGMITRAELRKQTRRLKGATRTKGNTAGYANVTSATKRESSVGGERLPTTAGGSIPSHAGVTFQDTSDAAPPPQVEVRLHREQRRIVLSCMTDAFYQELYEDMKALIEQRGISYIEAEATDV